MKQHGRRDMRLSVPTRQMLRLRRLKRRIVEGTLEIDALKLAEAILAKEPELSAQLEAKSAQLDTDKAEDQD